ncbi:MAG TPA: transcription factor [Candidatus Nanoarchaeia archaeon]|nr:transcription factor [Candidatus Nanoarchaeia archaeon]
MKISNKVIEEMISEVAGEDTLVVVKTLKNKKNVSEFKLAEDINREVNETRNMLYRLYYVNLVTFIRKKDKKKGWYIYYWTFNNKILKYLIVNVKKKKLEKLKERLEREKKSNFFICTNKCIRLDFEQAIDFEYKCPECGQLMFEDDNSNKIGQLEKNIKELEKELKKS